MTPWFSDRLSFRRQHVAMTLVELLVVVTIIIIMLAVAIPGMRNSIRENKIREASRQLNVLVARAKARAAETGRRAGIWLERTGPGSNASVDLFLCEVPNVYSGDFLGARCLLHFEPLNQTSDRNWRIYFEPPPSWPAPVVGPPPIPPTELNYSGGINNLIAVGEGFRIRFASSSVWYDAIRETNSSGVARYYLRTPVALMLASGNPTRDRLVPPAGFFRPGADGRWGAADADDDGNSLVDDAREAGINPPGLGGLGGDFVPANAIGLRYEIQMAPRRVSSTLVQLPEGTAVDLAASGVGIGMVPNTTTVANPYDVFLGMDFAVQNTRVVGASSRDDALAIANNVPVVVLFDPGGEVAAVGIYGTLSEPTGSVHFLVGAFDQVLRYQSLSAPLQVDQESIALSGLLWSQWDVTPVGVDKNTVDPSAILVSIGDRTGGITSSENGWELQGSPPNFYDSFRRARQWAQQAQSMGGR